MANKLTIAIDGYSGCGKSTIAKDVAAALNYVFIDSGAMYRGITLYAMQNNLIQNGEVLKNELIEQLHQINIHFEKNGSGKDCLFLNTVNVEDEIRKPAVAALVSKVATIKEVRQKLVQLQRKIGKNGGIVMDGRDIGSVVFPQAEVKLFVTAENNVRAQRRLDELKEKGIKTSLEEVLKNLEERDEMDRTRKESPLIQTDDAILIDTTHHTRESQLKHVLEIVRQKMAV